MSSNPYATPRARPDDPSEPIPHGGPVKADLRPVELLKAGKELISDQYWTFFGVAGLGILIGSAAPFGIVMGPMMCGIYMCFLKKARGESVELNLLFKGFDFFAQGFIAMLVMMVAMMFVIIPFMVGVVFMARGDPEAFLGMIFGMYGLIFVVSIGLGIFTMFAFPLIADRGYKAIDALKLSFKAATMNLGGLALMMLLNSVVSIFLMLFCYFPAFLFMPVSFAAFALAYLQIFPDE